MAGMAAGPGGAAPGRPCLGWSIRRGRSRRLSPRPPGTPRPEARPRGWAGRRAFGEEGASCGICRSGRAGRARAATSLASLLAGDGRALTEEPSPLPKAAGRCRLSPAEAGEASLGAPLADRCALPASQRGQRGRSGGGGWLMGPSRRTIKAALLASSAGWMRRAPRGRPPASPQLPPPPRTPPHLPGSGRSSRGPLPAPPPVRMPAVTSRPAGPGAPDSCCCCCCCCQRAEEEPPARRPPRQP